MASVRERNGKWQARVIRQGHPPQTRTFISYENAIKWARSIEVEIDTGAFVNPSHSNSKTFKEIIERYILEVCPHKRGGRDEAIRLTATLRNRICRYSMINVTPAVIAEYRDKRLRVVAANTVIRELAYLSSIINHARREWGLSISNPCTLVRKPKMPPGRNRILSIKEQEKLEVVARPIGKTNQWLAYIIGLALETAMRRGEILGLLWHNVNFENRTALLPMTKNGQARIVPLSSKALEILAQVPKTNDERVFPVTHCSIHAAFKTACKRAKLENLHFHDLRHTATTRLAEKLPNVLELASVTGHQTIQMLKRYYHPRAEDLALKLG